jgi:hypothetical protein
MVAALAWGAGASALVGKMVGDEEPDRRRT